MSEEDHSLGSDAAASADDGGGELPSYHIGSAGAHREEDERESIIEDEESDDDSEYEDEECSTTESETASEDEDPEFDRRIVNDFIEYALRLTGEDVTLEGLRDQVEQIPSHITRKALLENNILHYYVGNCAECDAEGERRDAGDDPAVIELEVVEYLIELSPGAVNKADDGEGFGHPNGEGAYPLHIACFNADCPVSVICLLLEKNPSAIEHSWDNSYGLPLNCYLARTRNHPSYGDYEDWGEGEEVYIETCPAFPSGDLDTEILRILIDAYPEALSIRGRMGTPLDTLCEGFAVSFELAKMLIAEDHISLQDFGPDPCPPIVRLLHNTDVQAFPDDLFCYLLECSPNSLELDPEVSDDDNDTFWDPGYQSNLYVACTNPKMTVETVAKIVDVHPEMVKSVYKFKGYLPLHRLCQNNTMEEQSAIDILNLLVSAHPESVKQKIAPATNWMLGAKDEFPINIADDYNMPFGFCKVLLTECTRQSSMPGCNILQTACINKCSLKLIKKLVEDDSQLLLMKDDEGHVALHTASKHTSLDVVKYLVANNKDAIMVPDKLGELPLHKACWEGKLNVVEYLMTRKPFNVESITLLNHRNRLPIHYLCSALGKSASLLSSVEYTETVFKMLNLYPKPQIMHIACFCKGSLGAIKRLVEDNHNILLLRDEERHVALHSAAKYASLDVVKYLVEQNEVGLTALDHARELPLHKACRAGKFDIVEYLMAKNPASVTVANRWNELPLHTLCDERCKSEHQLQSVKYTETVFKMLTVNPDPVKLDH